MLEQSGIEAQVRDTTPGTTTAIAAAPSSPGAVRVARAEGSTAVFAACRPDERLTGGGCEGGNRGQYSEHVVGYPKQYSPNDTRGARWYCSGTGWLAAYALCMAVGPSGSGTDSAPNDDDGVETGAPSAPTG